MIFLERLQKVLKSKAFQQALLFLGLGFLIAVIVNNFFLDLTFVDNSKVLNSGEKHQTGYKFISPLIECENNSLQGERDYRDLRKNILNYINGLSSANNLTLAAVYFRDLSNGPWFGVNENQDFAPSSLLKLPVLMAYLKEADTNKAILDKKILYDKDPAGLISQIILPKVSLEKGKEYIVSDLLYRMIVYSDNVSLRLLEDNIDSNLIDKVTLDLNIPTVTNNTPTDFMSVRQYSALFRVLYNASYLSKDMSEKTLSLLSKTDYKNGLDAKLPDNTVVSHKFGEREITGELSQLHDCGIVYYPNHPYLLCIMTRGKNLLSLQPVVQTISKMVFDEVNLRYK